MTWFLHAGANSVKLKVISLRFGWVWSKMGIAIYFRTLKICLTYSLLQLYLFYEAFETIIESDRLIIWWLSTRQVLANTLLNSWPWLEGSYKIRSVCPFFRLSIRSSIHTSLSRNSLVIDALVLSDVWHGIRNLFGVLCNSAGVFKKNALWIRITKNGPQNGVFQPFSKKFIVNFFLKCF